MMDFVGWVKETLRVCEGCEDGMMDVNARDSGWVVWCGGDPMGYDVFRTFF